MTHQVAANQAGNDPVTGMQGVAGTSFIGLAIAIGFRMRRQQQGAG